MSPGTISVCFSGSMVSTSPGHTDGSMLVPRAVSRIVARRRISKERSSLGSSQKSRAAGADPVKLRSLPVEHAIPVSGFYFAARQGHGLENPLVAKSRLLIGLFCSGRFLDRASPHRILVRLRHKKRARTRIATCASGCHADLFDYCTISGQVQCMFGHRY